MPALDGGRRHVAGWSCGWPGGTRSIPAEAGAPSPPSRSGRPAGCSITAVTDRRCSSPDSAPSARPLPRELTTQHCVFCLLRAAIDVWLPRLADCICTVTVSSFILSVFGLHPWVADDGAVPTNLYHSFPSPGVLSLPFFLCLIFDIFIRLFLCLPRLLVLCTDVAIAFAGNLEFSVHTSLRDSVFRISVSLGSDVLHFTLRAKFIGAVYCNRSCMWVCLFVCVFVDLLPR